VAVSDAGHGVTYAQGFTAGAVAAGVKHAGTTRLDVAVIVSDRPAAAGAVFTTNQVIAAPCLLSRRHVAAGRLRAIVANSGNANACTGAQGEADALAMAAAAAARLGCAPDEVAVGEHRRHRRRAADGPHRAGHRRGRRRRSPAGTTRPGRS